MLVVPTHSGSVDVVAATTMMALQRLIDRAGGTLTTRTHSGSVIATLRNLIVADFLASDCDALFMLDADQGVHESGLARMLGHGGLLVGCFYPKRQFDWSRIDPARAGDAGSIDALLYRAMTFVGAPLVDADGGARIADGFVAAEHVGAGAMLIRRPLLDALATAYPDLAGQGFSVHDFPAFAGAPAWGFFNPMPNEAAAGGGMLSEDLSFCRRWRAIGGEIWAEVGTPVAHAGRHVWAGGYRDFARALAEGA